MATEEICKHFNELRSDMVLLYELKMALANSEFELQTLKHQSEALKAAGADSQQQQQQQQQQPASQAPAQTAGTQQQQQPQTQTQQASSLQQAPPTQSSQEGDVSLAAAGETQPA